MLGLPKLEAISLAPICFNVHPIRCLQSRGRIHIAARQECLALVFTAVKVELTKLRNIIQSREQAAVAHAETRFDISPLHMTHAKWFHQSRP